MIPAHAKLIGKVGKIEFYLEGINVYSKSGKYGFSFLTPDQGFKTGEKAVPNSILIKASKMLFEDEE